VTLDAQSFELRVEYSRLRDLHERLAVRLPDEARTRASPGLKAREATFIERQAFERGLRTSAALSAGGVRQHLFVVGCAKDVTPSP